MKKLIRITTVPLSLNVLLKNQLRFLSSHYDITAISSPGTELQEVAKREQVRVVPVKMKRDISLLEDLTSLYNLYKIFKELKPEIVHSNTPKSSLLSMVAGKFTCVPFRLYTVTGLRFEGTTGFKRKLLIAIEKLTCRYATHVISESKGVKQMLIDYDITKKKIHIIGNGNINGIDPDYWNPNIITDQQKDIIKKDLNINNNDFVFIFVGRLVRDKGINELVQAFHMLQYPNMKLLLVGHLETGSDALKSDTLQLINSNPNITSLGFCEDIRIYLSISKVLILPSYREGFPNVLLQAGAFKLLSIVTKVNGADEVIDSMNGLFTEMKDSTDLAKKMELIIKDYEKYDKNYCRNKVLNLYTQDLLYPCILNFYNNLFDNHGLIKIS